MFLFERQCIGLDLGSKKIKMVQVKKERHNIQVVKFGSMDTPAETMDAGNITDPARLGECLWELVKKLGLEGRQIISSVSGQQIYIRNLIMPRMKSGELREAAIFQAMNFLPIPVEEAAIDVCPLRNFEDEEGKKTEIFFIAARQQQVQALQEVCNCAGLKLVKVEIEPLALIRIMDKSEAAGTVGVINIGAMRSYFSVYRDGCLTSMRALSFGCSAFYQTGDGNDSKDDIRLEDIDASGSNNYSYLLRDIMSEMTRSLEYYEMQNQGEVIQNVFICGGGSRLKHLDKYLASGLGRRIQMLEYTPRLILPVNVSPKEQLELQHDFPVAMGLAARGVI